MGHRGRYKSLAHMKFIQVIFLKTFSFLFLMKTLQLVTAARFQGTNSVLERNMTIAHSLLELPQRRMY